MAKKFGKFLLFTAAAGAAVLGAYYYLQKKSALASEYELDDDEDYDDFSEDLDETDSSRSYVPLNTENEEAASADTADSILEEAGDGDFSSLAEDVVKKADEKVEEFFDEENN